MSVVLRSNMPYRGALADLPPLNAPMPADAAWYADFLNDLFITTAVRGTDPTQMFNFSAMRERYLRNAAGGYTLAAAAAAVRSEYNASGQKLGLLVEGGSNQLLPAAMRTDLSQATATGLAVATGAAPDQVWDRWYSLTPTGDAGHDLRFASEAAVAASHRRTFAIELKSAGHRFVQLSSGMPGEATDFANFDVVNKLVTLNGGGVTFAGVLPTAEGCICYIQYSSAIAGIEAPTVSLIASAASARQEAAAASALGPVQARLPKLWTNATMTRVAPRSPLPVNASVLSDRLNLAAPFIVTDYTIALRARCSPWLNTWQPVLFALASGQSATTGVSLRATTAGNLALVSRVSNTISVLHEFSRVLQPSEIVTAAFSVASDGTLRLVMGSETYEGMVPQAVGAQPFVLSSPVEMEAFDGHLQRAIGWTHAKTIAQMQALLSEGV
ncbi:hypothetical protein [Paracoccus sp. PAR01]|uniref:hypothetical protein n=1 Tax=Paracoccus sp. PAR01 TaxID=2769282 RepID=UPI001781F8A0|nr:hypothetical protein [Paracoccus sp. PAR01]MBD9528660.1 hypothetical protein [Paracoccus sp. PAR01]